MEIDTIKTKTKKATELSAPVPVQAAPVQASFYEHDVKYSCCCDCTAKNGAESIVVVVVSTFLVISLCAILDHTNPYYYFVLGGSLFCSFVVIICAILVAYGMHYLHPKSLIPFIVLLATLFAACATFLTWITLQFLGIIEETRYYISQTQKPVLPTTTRAAANGRKMIIDRLHGASRSTTISPTTTIKTLEAHSKSAQITLMSIMAVITVSLLWWFYICIKAYRYVKDKSNAVKRSGPSNMRAELPLAKEDAPRTSYVLSPLDLDGDGQPQLVYESPM